MKKQKIKLGNPYEESNAFLKILDGGFAGLEDSLSGIKNELSEIKDLLRSRLN